MAELINKNGSFAERIIRFYTNLNPDFDVPSGVEVLQPYAQPAIKQVLEHYYHRYYSDNRPRIFLFGINPGRLGGGLTGIPFTDPVQLSHLDIQHGFASKTELSSTFIYTIIEAYGGMEKFAKDFFLTAVCPIGFIMKGKNYNYYDHPQLESASSPWIIKTLQEQLSAGASKKVAVCLGEGSNFKSFSKMNQSENLFDEIIALPHPRWIMQYRLKSLNQFVDRYVETLNQIRP